MRPPLPHLGQGPRGSFRQELIAGSFASSAALIAKAAKLFGDKDRKSLCLLEFHHEWQHNSCPVMSWYKLQQVSPGSTGFRRIKHIKLREPPFFHEFLLVPLDNGDVCRIERTGQGSRLDAIRNIGCTANDYIQYFSANDYEAYTTDQPSDLIAEINFPHDFDIMDILAVCYTIFENSRTRTYTLQRFNCYFFCATILLALTRRLVRWEFRLTFGRWTEALHQSLDHLRQLSRQPTVENLLLRVCQLLEPETAEPAAFMIEPLRLGLGASPDAFKSIMGALRTTLWRSTWPVHMKGAIDEHIRIAMKTALEGGEDCAKVFKTASCSTRNDMRRDYGDYVSVESIYNKKAVEALSQGLKAVSRAAREQYRMKQIEDPNSFLKETWLFVATHVIGAFFPIQMAMTRSEDLEKWGFKDIFLGNMRGIITAQAVGVMQARRLLGTKPHTGAISVGKTQSIDTAATAGPHVVQVNYDMANRTLGETLNELSHRGILTVPNITIAIHATLCKNIWNVWLNKSVSDLLGSLLPNMIDEDQEGILIRGVDENGATFTLNSVSEYQEWLCRRIDIHASRIQTYHLAAAPLVKQDTLDAIESIWGAIPAEYSSAVPASV